MAGRSSLRHAVGTLWRHHKGTLYRVVGYAKLEGCMELAVLYRRVDAPEDTIPWSRAAWQWRERQGDPLDRFTREEQG